MPSHSSSVLPYSSPSFCSMHLIIGTLAYATCFWYGSLFLFLYSIRKHRVGIAVSLHHSTPIQHPGVVSWNSLPLMGYEAMAEVEIPISPSSLYAQETMFDGGITPTQHR